MYKIQINNVRFFLNWTDDYNTSANYFYSLHIAYNKNREKTFELKFDLVELMKWKICFYGVVIFEFGFKLLWKKLGKFLGFYEWCCECRVFNFRLRLGVWLVMIKS